MEICCIDTEANDRNCPQPRPNLSGSRPFYTHPLPPFPSTPMKTRRLGAKNPISPSETKDLQAPSFRLSPKTRRLQRNRVTASRARNPAMSIQ